MSIKALDLVPGARYNWKGQAERLIFLGRRLYPNGFWYQFALVEKADKVWCEVRLDDLQHFEETKS
jgi:hypothetical protein